MLHTFKRENVVTFQNFEGTSELRKDKVRSNGREKKRRIIAVMLINYVLKTSSRDTVTRRFVLQFMIRAIKNFQESSISGITWHTNKLHGVRNKIKMFNISYPAPLWRYRSSLLGSLPLETSQFTIQLGHMFCHLRQLIIIPTSN